MVDWDPKEEMNLWQYVRFKLGRWVKVDTLPKWVKKAHRKDTRNKRLDLGFEKVYTGDSLKYKIIYTTQGRKVPQKQSTMSKLNKRPFFCR